MKLADLFDADTRVGRSCDLVVQGLVLTTLVSFSIETLPNLSPFTLEALFWVEVVTVAIFSVEYVLRIIAAERRLRFVFSFYGLVDLIASLPFYRGLGLDLKQIRLLRLLRLVRVLKLARYSSAVRRLHRAVSIAREELTLFGAVALIVLYMSSVGVYYFERDAQPEAFGSVFHSMWWAIATLTTVLGLVVAIPLVLLYSMIAAKSRALVEILEEQSAGMIARHSEQETF